VRRVCLGCGRRFDPKRPNNRYHSNACKQKAWRDRRAAQESSELFERAQIARRAIKKWMREGDPVDPYEMLSYVVWPSSAVLDAQDARAA